MQRLAKLLGSSSKTAQTASQERVVEPVNKQNRNGRTALHYALRDNPDFAAGLIADKTTDVNVADDNGDTPIHVAAGSAKADITLVKQLLGRGAMVNVQNKSGVCPLHKAVARGDEGVVAALLEGKVEVNYQTSKGAEVNFLSSKTGALNAYEQGDAPLHVALRQQNLSRQIITGLIKSGADIDLANHHYQTPMYLALANPAFPALDDETIKLFLDQQIRDFTSVGEFPTLFHVAANNPGMTRKLFEKLFLAYVFEKGDIRDEIFDLEDKNGQTPLVLAAAQGNLELIDYFAENPKLSFNSAEGELALKKAILNGKYAAAIKLIGLGVNPDVHIYKDRHSYGKSFTSMSSSSHEKRDGHDSTGMIEDGDTPLHVAVKLGNFTATADAGAALANACLEKRTSMVNSANARGKSPAFIALKLVCRSMAHQLWRANNDIKFELPVPGKEGRKATMMMEASRSGFPSPDPKELRRFFSDPDYKLCPAQEEKRVEKARKYFAATPKMVGKVSGIGVFKVREDSRRDVPAEVEIAAALVRK